MNIYILAALGVALILAIIYLLPHFKAAIRSHRRSQIVRRGPELKSTPEIRAAAELGDTVACHFMAQKAMGDNNIEEASKWAHHPAIMGDPKAQNMLAMLYESTTEYFGITRDTATAAKWYRRAAEQGDADAQFRLATLYDWGGEDDPARPFPFPQDKGEAMRLYKLAAAQGHGTAQHMLQTLVRSPD